MKTTSKLYITILILGISVTSKLSATGYLDISPVENSAKIKLELEARPSEAISFTVYNNQSKQVLERSIAGFTDYNEMIDLSGFKDGRYTLVSRVGNMKYNKVIRLKNNTLEVLDRFYTFEPVFQLQDDFLRIYHKDDKSDFVRIEIINRHGFFYELELDNDIVFQETLSLERMAEGNYTLRLYTSRENFSYDFEIAR